MKHPEWIILILWCIALFATVWLVKDKSVFIYLAPLYGVCMFGSIITIANIKKK